MTHSGIRQIPSGGHPPRQNQTSVRSSRYLYTSCLALPSRTLCRCVCHGRTVTPCPKALKMRDMAGRARGRGGGFSGSGAIARAVGLPNPNHPACNRAMEKQRSDPCRLTRPGPKVQREQTRERRPEAPRCGREVSTPPRHPRPALRLSAAETMVESVRDCDDWSGRRDSNPRPQPWQGCALPLSYARSDSSSRHAGVLRSGPALLQAVPQA